MKLTTYPLPSTDQNFDVSTSVFTGDTITAGSVVGLCNGKVADLSKNGNTLSNYIQPITYNDNNIVGLIKLSNTRVAFANFDGTANSRLGIVDYSNDYTSSTGTLYTPSGWTFYAGTTFIPLNQDTILYANTTNTEFGKITWSGSTFTYAPFGTGNTTWNSSYGMATINSYDILTIDSNNILVLMQGRLSSSFAIGCVWIDLAANTFYWVNTYTYTNSNISADESTGKASVRFTDGLNWQCIANFASSQYGLGTTTIYGSVVLTSTSSISSKLPKTRFDSVGYTNISHPTDIDTIRTKRTVLLSSGIKVSLVNDYESSDNRPCIRASRNYTQYGAALNNSGLVRLQGKVTNMSDLIPGALYNISGRTLSPCIKRENAFGQALSATDFLIF